MRYINSSNYENDEREYLLGFLSYITEDKQKKKCIIDTNNSINDEIPLLSKNSVSKLSNLELSSLYNIGGYLLHFIKKTFKIYDACLQSAGSKNELKYSFTKFVQLKYYIKNSLFFINKNTLKIFIAMEQRFRYYTKYFDDINNIKLFLIKNFNNIELNVIFLGAIIY